MKTTNPISDFAKLTFKRLAKLPISPALENTAKYYYEISGEPMPSAPKYPSCAEIIQGVVNVLNAVTINPAR